MNNKKNYNNLFDSIMVLLLSLFLIVMYVIIIVFGCLKNENNKVFVCIICSVIFIPAIITTFIMIFHGCFGWWKIDGEHVIYKKLLKKKIQIKSGEIVTITEEVIPALILGTYKTNAIIIKSHTEKIVIYTNKKITVEFIMNLLQN